MCAKKSSKKRNPGAELWENAAEVPRAGMPDAITLEKRRKWMRLMILAWPVIIPFGIGAVTAAQQEDPTASLNAIATTDGRAAAERALLEWLHSDPAPLPDAQLLSWDGADNVPVPDPTEAGLSDTVAFKMEINKFTLITPDGQSFQAGVQVATSEKLGAIVLGSPSLIPIPPSADVGEWAGVSAWPGYTATSIPEPVMDAINAWAKAFTGADPAQLRLVTGDPDGTHFYMPLIGVSSVSVSADQAAALTEVTTAGVPPERMVVQAGVSIIWYSQVVPAEAQQPTPTVITYDLVIAGADTASPRVVAWGAAGTGPKLTDFSNAVVGRAIDVSGLTNHMEQEKTKYAGGTGQPADADATPPPDDQAGSPDGSDQEPEPSEGTPGEG